MNSADNTFNFDRIEWEKLSSEEQEGWFDWAEDCGAKREVHLAERNPYYPDMICAPAVSLNLSSEEIHKILELCEEPPKISKHMQSYINKSG